MAGDLMAAPTDSSGTEKYWSDGLPFDGVNKAGNDPGTEKFWFDGLPEMPLIVASSTVTASSMLLVFD